MDCPTRAESSGLQRPVQVILLDVFEDREPRNRVTGILAKEVEQWPIGS
jgi:hypothetical protein